MKKPSTMWRAGWHARQAVGQVVAYRAAYAQGMNTPDDDSDAEWWFRQSEKALWRAAWHRRFARRLAALGMC